MRFKKLLAVITLTAFLTLPFATAALAASGLEIGVEDDAMFTSSAGNANRGLQAAEELRAHSLRVFVSWAATPGANPNSRKVPRKRRYSFHRWDGLVTRANLHHMTAQLVLTGPAPAWATGNHRVGPDNPQSKYFGEFAREAAQYFGARVTRYSIWNEPNYVGWLSPQGSAPGLYRALYQQGYSNIKRVNPKAQVLIGETSPYAERRLAIAPLAFMRAVLCNGRCHLRADGYAHHPYDFYHSPTYRYPGGDNVTIATLSRLSGALRGWAHSGALRTPQGGVLPIYLTEYGYLSSGRSAVSASRHGSYLVKAFQIALKTPGVKELVQYGLTPPHGHSAYFNMSILTSRWGHTKAFNTLAAWARLMEKRHEISVPIY